MAVDALASVQERALREITVILREVLAQRDAEGGHVARGRELAGVGQAVGIAEDRAVHAELTRLGGHHAGEVGFVAADEFTQRGSRVVRRLGDHRQDGGLDGDRATRADTELRRRLGGGLGRERNLAVLAELAFGEGFEGQVERHHLGEGRGITASVGFRRIQNLAGLSVDDDGRLPRRPGGCATGDDKRHSQRKDHHLSERGHGSGNDARQRLTHWYVL